ncbi:TOBE domain protein [compost metagenome]
MSIRPEDFQLGEPAAGVSRVNLLSAQVDFAIFTGAAVEAEVRCGETRLFCLLARDADMTPGSPITLRFSPDVCVVLPEEA